jgi:hypothetical protein
MIINRIYENKNLLSLYLVSFLVGLRTYQHPGTNNYSAKCSIFTKGGGKLIPNRQLYFNETRCIINSNMSGVTL